MCGICGKISLKSETISSDLIVRMTSSLAHRGPDDSGLIYDEAAGVGLAHRRLSIIDLSSAGHQPMKSDDGKVCICYNGEIYNFIRIRKLLVDCGHRFKSATDTEVVLKAYLQWGTECLEKFVGMFAFTIWDRRNQTLFLARDRLGIKPLYYYIDDEGILFASEIKALLQHPAVKPEPDFEAIQDYITYQYVMSEKTFFKGIYKILPGRYQYHRK